MNIFKLTIIKSRRDGIILENESAYHLKTPKGWHNRSKKMRHPSRLIISTFQGLIKRATNFFDKFMYCKNSKLIALTWILIAAWGLHSSRSTAPIKKFPNSPNLKKNTLFPTENDNGRVKKSNPDSYPSAAKGLPTALRDQSLKSNI